ncbi:MAG: glycosyltransferase family 2 protein [Candidatus Omnitrophica bacterium]|nr:glycosyltransferase family 2 protein [Candidatus Omnitrophota bacterium]
MFKGNKISLVIPAFNEQECIGTLLPGIPGFVDEVIVVDNGSTDKTAEISKLNGASVIYEKRRGYGVSLKTGILTAQGDIIICLDADGSYPLTVIEDFLKLLTDNEYDFISGQRINLNINNAMPLINRIGNKIISCLINLFFGIHLKDSQSGMWAFKKEVFSKIAPVSPGMGFSQEIKIRAWLNPDIACYETNIPYDRRLGGRSKFNRIQDSVTILYDVFYILKEHYGLLQYKKNNL